MSGEARDNKGTARRVLVKCQLFRTPGSFNYRSTPIHVSRCAQSLAQLPPRCAPRCASRGNIAEIEIAILERNALSRRLPDEAALRRQVLAVETERNQQQRGICLPVHFT